MRDQIRVATAGLMSALLLATASVTLGQAVPGVTGGTSAGTPTLRDRFETIHNDFNWIDDKGERIFTRSGSLAQFNGTFYWYGSKGGQARYREQCCYTSTDLVHWTSAGVALRTDVEVNRIEVLYNDRTNKYVMILKYDGNGAHFGVATADKPEGPFTFIKQAKIEDALIGDMSVFKDDDGTAYLAYVSWKHGTNASHGIYKLSADYLTPEENVFHWRRGAREATHLFKRNGIYYYGTSETAWIDSSETEYYTATNLAGAWSAPRKLETPGSDNTWDTQVDFIFPIQGTAQTTYLYVGDRWIKDATTGRYGDYVFLPLEFDGDRAVLNYHHDWDLNVATGAWRPFDASRNLAAGKPVAASSEVAGHGAANVTDQPAPAQAFASFWRSETSDPQWVRVDLGQAQEVNRVVLKWSLAAAKSFTIQTSTDGESWADVYATDLGFAKTVTDVTFPTQTARYVRMLGTVRAEVQPPARPVVRGNPGAGTQPATSRPVADPPHYSLIDFAVYRD